MMSTNLVSGCVAEGYHEALKSSRELFEAATERLPHHQHAEAIQDGLLYRNCTRCRSTLTFEIAPLDRITDFDEVEPATALDHVSWMVSDEMMAADRAQREAAFAVAL